MLNLHSVSIDIKIYSIMHELLFIGKFYDIYIWPETFIK